VRAKSAISAARSDRPNFTLVGRSETERRGYAASCVPYRHERARAWPGPYGLWRLWTLTVPRKARMIWVYRCLDQPAGESG